MKEPTPTAVSMLGPSTRPSAGLWRSVPVAFLLALLEGRAPAVPAVAWEPSAPAVPGEVETAVFAVG